MEQSTQQISSLLSNEREQEEDTLTQFEQEWKKKTFMQRYFSPMKEGSLRGSIFALLASAMGTGVFNLPFRTSQIGVIPFAIFIFLGAFFSMIGMIFIMRLIRQNNFKSYSQMSQTAYGKYLKWVAQFCNIIYPWGITICFQVIFAKFACQLLYDQFGVKIYDSESDKAQDIYNHHGNIIRILINLGCHVVTLFFALKKQVSLLQKIAIIGVVSVIFNITALLIISMVGFTKVQGGQTIVYHGMFKADASKVLWFNTDGAQALSLLAQGMASILFCYVNHQLMFPLSTSLKRPSKSRFNKIIYRVHAIQFIAYSSIGIFAYLLLLQNLDKTHPIASVVIESIPTKVTTFGKSLMLAALFFAVPLNMFPARQSFFEAFSIQKSNKNHILVSLGMMISSTLVAIFFTKVNSYFGLLGGTAGVMMAGGIPALCYYKLQQKLTKVDVTLLVMCAIISVLAVIGAVLSVA